MMDGGGGDSNPPQGKDWFGNSLPTDDPVCNLNEDTGPDVAPPNADPAIKSAVIKIEVAITGSKAHKFGGLDQMCLPVALHVYGTASGQPALKIDEGGHVLPWSGVRTTPWSASFALTYDSTKVGKPVVNIDLLATYTPEIGINSQDFSKAGVMQMNCNILINGVSRRSFLGPESTVTLTLDKPSTVRCQATISA